MQVTETLVEGLKREFKVVVPASELDERLSTRLSTLKDEVRIKGFRPGKVPVSHLRRMFGKSAMSRDRPERHLRSGPQHAHRAGRARGHAAGFQADG